VDIFTEKYVLQAHGRKACLG